MEADSVDSASSPSSSGSGVKLCRVCGKDLAGHRRVKDSLGYICVACVKAEKKHETAGTVPCAECKRRLKPSGLVPWRNTMICRSCLKDHEEINRFKTPPPSLANHDAYQRYRLLILLGVLVVLAVIMVLSQMGIIGGKLPDNLSPADRDAATRQSTESHK